MIPDQTPANTGHHLPTPAQTLLLKTILGPSEQLIANWQRWQHAVALDDIDHGSFRIIPMLYHVLRQHGAEGPDLARYAGMARKAWYQNKLIFHPTAQLIRQWQSEGRELAVVKGFALAHLYYPDPGLRPMADADILVPPDQAIPSINWFFEHGWHHKQTTTQRTIVTYLVRKEHSADMSHESGLIVDLHWQILNFPLPPILVQDIWDATESVKIGGLTIQTLCPTDHLLHICAHGNAWNAVPPLRWIIDAHLILKKDAAIIDWERFIRLTEQLHIAHFITPALNYLREEFHQPIPPDVLSRLGQIPRQKWHDNEYQTWISPDPHSMRDYSLRYRYQRLRATCPEWQRKSKWRAQRDYLKLHWELDSDFQLIRRICQRIGLKLWEKVRG